MPAPDRPAHDRAKPAGGSSGLRGSIAAPIATPGRSRRRQGAPRLRPIASGGLGYFARYRRALVSGSGDRGPAPAAGRQVQATPAAATRPVAASIRSAPAT